jgi:hypothetical protein
MGFNLQNNNNIKRNCLQHFYQRNAVFCEFCRLPIIGKVDFYRTLTTQFEHRRGLHAASEMLL